MAMSRARGYTVNEKLLSIRRQKDRWLTLLSARRPYSHESQATALKESGYL